MDQLAKLIPIMPQPDRFRRLFGFSGRRDNRYIVHLFHMSREQITGAGIHPDTFDLYGGAVLYVEQFGPFGEQGRALTRTVFDYLRQRQAEQKRDILFHVESQGVALRRLFVYGDLPQFFEACQRMNVLPDVMRRAAQEYQNHLPKIMSETSAAARARKAWGRAPFSQVVHG